MAQAEAEKKTPAEQSSVWSDTKHWVWKYLGTLVMDAKNGGQALSLGRLSFWAVLGLALWMWSPLGGPQDIPETMGTCLLALMGYNLGSKGFHVAGEIFGKGPTPPPEG